jgi:hypothetical protein
MIAMAFRYARIVYLPQMPLDILCWRFVRCVLDHSRAALSLVTGGAASDSK